jgi:hypothetical protein
MQEAKQEDKDRHHLKFCKKRIAQTTAITGGMAVPGMRKDHRS